MEHTGVDTSIRDDLVACLQILARSHGVEASRDTLVAGLPLHGPLTPSLFGRAAQRIGFSARVVGKPLAGLNPLLLPAILLLKDHRACLLYGLDTEAGQARVVFPDLGMPDQPIVVPLEKLAADYLGHAVYCRPGLALDRAEPTPPAAGHWFWDVIKDNRRIYRDILLAALFVNLFALAMPLFVMNVYDRVVPNQATDTLWVLALGIVLVLAADLTLKHMRSWFVDVAAARADLRLSSTLMERVLGMRLAHRPASVGAYASTIQAFESVRSFIGSMTIIALVDIPFFLLFVLIIGIISPWLALPLVVGTVLAMLYGFSIAGRMNALAEETSQASAQRNASLVESLYALDTLKSFGATHRAQSVWERATEHLGVRATRQRLLGSSVSSSIAQLQQVVGIAMILVGVYLVIQGDLSQGGLIAAYMLSSRAMAPVAQTASLMTSYYQARTALQQANDVVGRAQERPAGKVWIDPPALRGDIEFAGVTFTYPDQKTPSLRDVSFRIRSGERVGIVGKIGSGKSTINKLLLGLYQPADGTVLIDGTHQAQIDPDHLRRQIGYIPQEPVLLAGSVLENILLGAPLDTSSAQVAEAVRIAGLGPLLESSPDGLMMPVGENGARLSGGQRQAIAVARAVVRDPRILVFDEPTSAMDGPFENHVAQALKTYAEGRTLVLVTHKTALLDLVDRLIVIDGGRVLADGPKAAVLEALGKGLPQGRKAA